MTNGNNTGTTKTKNTVQSNKPDMNSLTVKPIKSKTADDIIYYDTYKD